MTTTAEQTLSVKRRRLGLRGWVLGCALLAGVCWLGYKAIHHQQGKTVPPPADAEAGRWVVLEGANNTRDLGGYRTADGRSVKWKTVYRSAELEGLSDAGGQAFCDLGVRRVIDFRYRQFCSPLFGGDAFSVFRCSSVSLLPVHSVSSKSDHPYVESVQRDGDSYRQAFEMIAQPENLPVMYHCQAGKDRTGILSALLLTLLGVDRQTVLEDFSLSDQVERASDAGCLTDLLDEVERRGGIESYLEGIGVARETQERIRILLLE